MAKGKKLIYTIQLTDKGTFRIKELDKEVKDLGKAFVSINGDIQEHTSIIQGTMSAYEQEIRTLKTLRDQTAKTAAQYSEYNTQIVGVEKKMKKLTSAQMSQEQVNAQMIANTGLASNTIVEFGRTISDAPFGIIGVTNNLSNFELLSGKVGGTQNMFKLLIRQLKKGGAFVLAIQVALAAMTLFRDEITEFVMGTKKAEKAVEELKEELQDTDKVLIQYIKTLKNVNVALADQLELVRFIREDFSTLDSAFKNSNATQEEQIDITRRYLIVQQKLSKKNQEINEDLENLDKKRAKKIRENEAEIKYQQKQLAQEIRERDAMKAAGLTAGWKDYDFLQKMIPIREKQIQALKEDNVELGINIELVAERNELLRLTAKILANIPRDIELGDDLFKPFMDEETKFDEDLGVRVMDRLLGISDKEFREGFDAIEWAEEYGLTDSLDDLATLIDEHQTLSAVERINILQQESLTKLEILYDQIEEETGLRIGFEEDKTKIEEFYANKRMMIADVESQSKAKSLRVAAQAAQQVGKLMQQVAEEDKGLAIAGVIVEKAAAIAKIIANKSIADAATLPLMANPATAPLAAVLRATNKVTMITGIAATTASAVQAIKEIRNPESATASTTAAAEGATPQIQAPNFNVVGATQQSQLAQVISGQEERPVKAFVVADDVTTTQELLRKVAVGASLG